MVTSPETRKAEAPDIMPIYLRRPLTGLSSYLVSMMETVVPFGKGYKIEIRLEEKLKNIANGFFIQFFVFL
jgi:hypothetical protein